jgi:hypothetical protein
MGSFPPRVSYLKQEEVTRYIQWKPGQSIASGAKAKVEDSDSDENKAREKCEESPSTTDTAGTPEVHPLVRLKSVLEEQLKLIKSGRFVSNNIEISDLENGLGLLDNVFQYLEEAKPNEGETTSNILELVLPAPDPISELYTARPIFVLIDRPANETLPIFWITGIPPAFELDSEHHESDLVRNWPI